MKETLNFIHVKNLRDVLIKNHIQCFFASFSILVKRYFKKGLIIFIPMLKKANANTIHFESRV